MNLSKERDYFFDNVKFILILLVVIGHFIEPIIENDVVMKSIYLFIYSFHMPAFVLLSGYFSKIDSSKFKLKTIDKYLISYLIFQILFILFSRFALPGQYDSADLLQPYYIYWYLFALFVWNMLLPYLSRIKFGYVISILICLGIAAGYTVMIDGEFSLSRIIVFFPYFLLGYSLKKEHIIWLRKKLDYRLAAVILVCTFISFAVMHRYVNVGWLQGSIPYVLLHGSHWYSGVYRIMVYIISLFTMGAFFVLIPARKTIYSELGTQTLTVFLLHGFIVKGFIALGFYSLLTNTASRMLLIVLGVATTLLLSTKLIGKILKPIAQPGLLTMIFKRRKSVPVEANIP